jgi:hypothetical protein
VRNEKAIWSTFRVTRIPARNRPFPDRTLLAGCEKANAGSWMDTVSFG